MKETQTKGEKEMKKERDIQTLEKVAELLKEAFRRVTYDMEDRNGVFNSDQALEVMDKYTSITTSLDEMLYDLGSYFEDLAFIHREE